jgi:hypothetical protein
LTQFNNKENTMFDSESTFEFDPEMGDSEVESFEFDDHEWSGEDGEVFNEGELMELAAELMEISSEEELDYFLGNLLKRAASTIGKVARSPIGKSVVGVLKTAAKKALPIAGGAIGTYFGGPLGARIGSGLASAAGSALGLEGEALSMEDQQFEGGKQFVRFAGDTIKKALTAPGGANPKAIAQSAVMRAARVHAPGLLHAAHTVAGVRASKGRWVRRGRNIIVLNA